MSEYTITDLTPAEAKPERLTARADLTKVLTEWANRNGLPAGDIEMETDSEDALTIVLPDLTMEGDDIVPNERDYEYTATILVEVTVRGSVTARNEDTATEEAEYQLESAELDIDAYGMRVENWDIQSVSVDEVEVE